MTRLVAESAKYIRARIADAAATLATNGELRSVFHGPPMRFLEPLLDELGNDGGIEVTLATEEHTTVPVLLPMDEWTQVNPVVGASGKCDQNHILALRNTPEARRFLVLAAPARHTILSIAQATDELGVASATNGGGSDISDLWNDSFFQTLVEAALSRVDWPTDAKRNSAKELLEEAVVAADEFERHSAQRQSTWNALARVLSISNPDFTFGTLWSLACGFPPLADGGVDANRQTKILTRLTDSLIDEGFSPCMERLKQGATSEESEALDELLAHLRARCEVHSELARCASFLYSPFWEDEIGIPPIWWQRLTVERLAQLLEDDAQPEDSLLISCANPLVPAGRGLPVIVLDRPSLLVQAAGVEAGQTLSAVVSRAAPKGTPDRAWSLTIPMDGTVVDDSVPPHRQPLRYLASSDTYKDSTLRVVSLAHWEPGVIASCRSAKKVTLPKRPQRTAGVDLELNIVLEGEGRHLIDLFVSPRHQFSTTVSGVDTTSANANDEELEACISNASPESYGLEIVATNECLFNLQLITPELEKRTLRINVTCEEIATEGCRTEFERLVRLNRLREKAVSAVVHPERQSRLSNLEGWYLNPDDVIDSCYPLVLGTDCGDAWTKPQWGSPEGSILSRAVFLHDPRPVHEDFAPPGAFLEAREKIAARIRAVDDGYGLTDTAELGTWFREKEFAEQLDAYLRSYLKWLIDDPDIACWADVAVVCPVERDGTTLSQEPDAVLFSPIHPIRLAWQALAQATLSDAIRAHLPCPAASILNPDGIPDALALPLRTPAGSVRRVVFLATECSSDYWSVLWNATRLDRLGAAGFNPPFDTDFGVRLGGVSSGFSVSQVRRALDDIAGSLLAAKPTINVLVTSSSGQTDACTDGLMSWAREEFSLSDKSSASGCALGPRLLNVFDERRAAARPEEAAIANLSEDTGNATKWFSAMPDGNKPDLGIVAQLEASNANAEASDVGSPLGVGGLIRHRIRTQLSAGNGAFLIESRMAVGGSPSGRSIADLLMSAIVRIENLGETRFGYSFAPSVSVISSILRDKGAEFAAVSSSAVDPACFLGGWLEDMYLWDYELPSYSHRAGDTNGYYLLSQVRPLDCDSLGTLLKSLPSCESLEGDFLGSILLEVAHRGMPTVRGLSASHSGAAGDLGLFLAGRVLQDEFRSKNSAGSLLKVASGKPGSQQLALVVPVDPFRGYLNDLQKAIGASQFLRPDLMVLGLNITDSSITCKITPLEVKFRKSEIMSAVGRKAALDQARSMSALLTKLSETARSTEHLLWKLAFQHVLLSMTDFAFRVYSQHLVATGHPREWSGLHQRVTAAILSEELGIEIDGRGRLLVFDRSSSSAPHDTDQDGFSETIVVSPTDAGRIVRDEAAALYDSMKRAVGDWGFFPTAAPAEGADNPPEQEPVKVDLTTLIPTDTVLVPAPAPALASPHESSTTGREQAVKPNPPSTPQTMTDGMQILVGTTATGFNAEPRFLVPSNTALNQLNMGVVGDLGTGKTQLLKSLIYQIRNAKAANANVQPRFLIFDYKKDYSSDDFVSAVGARVVKPHKLPLNLFDISQAAGETAPWLNRFKFFADVLDKIFSNVGPVQRENLKQSVKKAYEEAAQMGRQPTIYDIHDKYRERLQDKPDAPLSIIGDIVDSELFDPDPANTVSFQDFMDGAIVVSLDSLGQDDHTKNMLVAIMLNMFYEYMLKLPKRPYRGAEPQLRVVDSYLLVDEADNIMRYEFDVLRKILLQGREFGVGVILASQYLKHFKAGATDYREPLLTWFIHKVPNISAQELLALGLTSATPQLADEIRQLPNHWCMYKSFGSGGDIIHGDAFYKMLKRT